jgi:uncharacterized protein (DUF1778 family)
LSAYGNVPYTTVPRGINASSHQQGGEKRSAPKVYRFDARLDEDQKLLIQRAAELEGRTMTDFVLHSATVAAEQTIQERAMMLLSVRDTQAFVTAILSPAAPGSVLRAAARDYKTRVSRRRRTA